MKYKGASPDVAEVGRKLGVDYVLEGALRTGSQRLGITVQLIRVSDQTHLWAQEYNPSPGDPLSLEYSVAERTAGALRMQLLPSAQKSLSEAHSIKPEAQEAYLRGRYILSHVNATTIEQA